MSSGGPFDPKKFTDELHDRIHRDVHDALKSAEIKVEPGRRAVVIGVSLVGRRGSHGGIITGAILVLIGLAFLLHHLGYISINYLWRFWPMLIVLAGIANVASSQRRVSGVLLILSGTVLQLNYLGITHFGWGDLWPMALIALG